MRIVHGKGHGAEEVIPLHAHGLELDGVTHDRHECGTEHRTGHRLSGKQLDLALVDVLGWCEDDFAGLGNVRLLPILGVSEAVQQEDVFFGHSIQCEIKDVGDEGDQKKDAEPCGPASKAFATLFHQPFTS